MSNNPYRVGHEHNMKLSKNDYEININGMIIDTKTIEHEGQTVSVTTINGRRCNLSYIEAMKWASCQEPNPNDVFRYLDK